MKEVKEIKVEQLEEMVEKYQKQARSTWTKGVCNYCFDFIQDLKDWEIKTIEVNKLKTLLLNGARNWDDYSWGGSSLIYNDEIAKRLCTPSEFRRKKEGKLKPNKREEWLDTQARALCQACYLLESLC